MQENNRFHRLLHIAEQDEVFAVWENGISRRTTVIKRERLSRSLTFDSYE